MPTFLLESVRRLTIAKTCTPPKKTPERRTVCVRADSAGVPLRGVEHDLSLQPRGGVTGDWEDGWFGSQGIGSQGIGSQMATHVFSHICIPK